MSQVLVLGLQIPSPFLVWNARLVLGTWIAPSSGRGLNALSLPTAAECA